MTLLDIGPVVPHLLLPLPIASLWGEGVKRGICGGGLWLPPQNPEFSLPSPSTEGERERGGKGVRNVTNFRQEMSLPVLPTTSSTSQRFPFPRPTPIKANIAVSFIPPPFKLVVSAAVARALALATVLHNTASGGLRIRLWWLPRRRPYRLHHRQRGQRQHRCHHQHPV